MKHLRCVLLICTFAVNAISAGLPTDIVSVPIELDGKLALKIKGFPEAFSSRGALKATHMLATRETLEWMEGSGLLVKGFSRRCSLHLAADVTKSHFYTNEVWFAAAVRKAKLLRETRTVLLWTDAPTLVQSRAELKSGPAAASQVSTSPPGAGQPPNRPPGGDRDGHNTVVPASWGCELSGELCLSSDGAASFSIACGDVSFTVDTQGEFTIEAKGANGVSSSATIGIHRGAR